MIARTSLTRCVERHALRTLPPAEPVAPNKSILSCANSADRDRFLAYWSIGACGWDCKRLNMGFWRALLHLCSASDSDNRIGVPGKPKSKHRSGCPVSVSLEILGDRWSLLIIRDLMVRGFRTFKDFQGSGKGLQRTYSQTGCRNSRCQGSLPPARSPTDARRINYRLTEKGIDLAPVLLELLIWGSRHEETMAPQALILQMESNRNQFLAEVRRRWQERDSTPLIPRFGNCRPDNRDLPALCPFMPAISRVVFKERTMKDMNTYLTFEGNCRKP